jgi:hypothetical protein
VAALALSHHAMFAALEYAQVSALCHSVPGARRSLDFVTNRTGERHSAAVFTRTRDRLAHHRERASTAVDLVVLD